MKKRYTALFAAAFALSMIAGCGGNEKADTGATAKAQPAVEQGKGAGLRGEAAPTFTLKNIAGEDVAVEAKGKPYSPTGRFFFNWAHSGDWILCGVGPGALGVDVERPRRGASLCSVAARFFRPEEYQAIVDAPEETRGDLFRRYWTMKESYLKYTGDEGLAGGLHDVDVAALWAGQGSAAGRNFPLPDGAMAGIVASPSLLPREVTMISVEELRAGLEDF